MWKLILGTLYMSALALAQNQFHRQVVNPRGPSQVILSGGGFNNGNGEGASIPLQGPVDDAQPIPENGGENNPFTSGDEGFGLRLENPPRTPPESVAQQNPHQQPQIVQQPQVVQQQQPQQLQQQPTPVVQQAPLILPPLQPGHVYVDAYGVPLLFGQPQVQVQAPQTTPAPPPPPPTTTAAPVHTIAFVDQYGRKVGQSLSVLSPQQLAQGQIPVAPAPVPVFQHAPQPVYQNFIQPATFPVVQEVAQSPAVPVVKKLIQATDLIAPVIAKKDVPPPLTLHTYAVPQVRQVGNLLIPYAGKYTIAKTQDFAYHAVNTAAPTAADIKSVHKTVLSPVKEVKPVAEAAPAKEVTTAAATAGVPVVQEAPAAFHAPTLLQEHQQLVLQQPQVAVQQPQLIQYQYPPQVQVAQQLVPVAQQQHLVPVEHQQHLVPVSHHQHLLPVGHPVQVVQNSPAIVEHHPVNQVVQLTSPPAAFPYVTADHAPVLVKKIKPAAIVPAVAKVPVIEKTIIEKTVIPDVTLIHQPIYPKALFQRHIFNVKHGSEPIIYQDLCTVYPYQKNLRACVLKKAVLPELHHPDIRTLNVEDEPEQPQTDQSVIAAGSPIIAPALPDASPTVVISKTPPKNIQETIKRESTRSREKAIAAATATQPTTAQPEAAESRTSSSGKSRRRKSKGSSRTSTTTEKAFKLA